MDTFKDLIAELREAAQHIENNRVLAVDDLKDGDGYEALEYLDNMTPWIKAIQYVAGKLGKPQAQADIDKLMTQGWIDLREKREE